ncbi:type 2 periplasmic-binding domain-containing protein [Flavobacterium cellulosilyticum]|uniref:Por secretion system C-terminal sorting domain-containing protein n=1 Tax=Flavobacterium cellulosilyticum TaxID=2541731 RepID=A0A4V2Z023_9FLAO|nr:hypothetical protein [Flavobacterium cellulosilyticum]TDD99347.1 hypothetical protein E0F76_01050 [Flavobacterium cellulosilyticum]
MKKILKISLVMVGIVSTLNANATNSTLLMNLKKVEGKKVSFTLNDMKSVNLSIYDSNDDLIFKEDLTGKKSFRTYDLASFPEGEYYMVTENDLKISKYKLEIKGGLAILSPEAISEVFKPVFDYSTEYGMLTINLEKNAKTPVMVSIYDSNRELLYSKTNSSNEITNKVFNLKKLKGEECTFYVSYSGKTFEKSFTL